MNQPLQQAFISPYVPMFIFIRVRLNLVKREISNMIKEVNTQDYIPKSIAVSVQSNTKTKNARTASVV
jgi:hypothetical protein